jgi:glycosyltransferase involved in cell wall biosynthesis
MACAKPVIAANTSSLAEIIDHGVNGILCPSEDINAFVAACRTLANERQMCNRYGNAARDCVESRFSEDVVVLQYVDLYQTILGS